jgi:uncharacterized protein YbcV (DUF1398 family)
MFTLEQIKTAHSNVKSGADFPAYIGAIKTLGVTRYDTYVTDCRTDYKGNDNYTVNSPGRFGPLFIATTTDAATFKAGLKAHQEGQTDFMQFIQLCAETGIEKWTVRMDIMTCTYYDIAGNEVLKEGIPG